MATTTFKLGDMIVHRIIEMECGFTPALEFLPKLTPQMLDESRSWMKNRRRWTIRIVWCCASSPISCAPANTLSWSIVASATIKTVQHGQSGT